MRTARRAGFTMIELLVVVAIILVLVGILIPSLSAARANAKQTKAMSDLRQMMTGYTMYHQENDGRVLLGYPPAALLNGFYEPRLNRHFTGIDANLAAMRYAWRLMPYVANLWPILHSHEPMPPLPGGGDSDAEIMNKAYALSLYPTYGLNSIYVGGDLTGEGYLPLASPIYPNAGRHVVFKANEVRRAGELIVFGQVRNYNGTSTSGNVGHFRLTPPRAGGVQWHLSGDRPVADVMAPACGIPQGWYKKDVAVGFFDGHAESLKPERFYDMRLWANDAERPDYDYVP